MLLTVQLFVHFADAVCTAAALSFLLWAAVCGIRLVTEVKDVTLAHVRSIGDDGESKYLLQDLMMVPPPPPPPPLAVATKTALEEEDAARAEEKIILPPSVARATEEEWEAVRKFRDALRAEGALGTTTTSELFEKWGGEDRCCLRITRANDLNLNVALKQFREICEYRDKYRIADLAPETVIDNPVKPFWVGELPGLAQPTLETAHTKGCVVQCFKVGLVQPKRIVELFSQTDLDSFIILWMERRQQLQRHSIATNPGDFAEDRMLEIYDFTGLRSSQFNFKGLRMLSNSLKLCQANYPEDLCQTYMINVPKFFNMAWSMITPGLRHTYGRISLFF